MKDEMWDKLYTEAKRKLNYREISPFISGGQCAAALLTDKGNIYTGVCVDTASTLGICAERNAVFNMITNGEFKIVKLVCVIRDGSVGSPCGACRELLMQLDENSGDIEILVNRDSKKTVLLKDLVPDWWGESRFKEKGEL